MAGRPSLLTDQVQTQICDALRAGNYDYIAAEAFGVDRQTFMRWKRLGSDEAQCIPEGDPKHDGEPCSDGPHPPGECPHLSRYRDFRKAVDRAEKEHEVKAVAEITLQGKRDADAHWKILRSRYPDRWNPATRTEITGAGGQPIEIMVSAQERLRAKVNELHARATITALPSGKSDDAAALDGQEEPDGRAEARDRKPEHDARAPRARPRTHSQGPRVA